MGKFIKYFYFLCIFFLADFAFTQEICNNGIDDDNDQLIDLNDPDCDCPDIPIFSMIPNPSFEEYDCCPSDLAQMECATGWIQASKGTSDYMNLCGWYDQSRTPPPLPIPHGQGLVRIIDGYLGEERYEQTPYKEYVGACLNEKMDKNKTYKLTLDIGFKNQNLSPDFRLGIFGTSDCAKLPFGGADSVDCPTRYDGWQLIDEVEVNNIPNSWSQLEFTLDPEFDVRAIAIGPSCRLQKRYRKTYYFLDQLFLYEVNRKSPEFELINEQSMCDPEFIFEINDQPNVEFQWYKEGVALVGETRPRISRMYGEGNYQITITNSENCRSSGSYIYEIPAYDFPPQEVTICTGEFYQFGGNLYNEPGIYSQTLLDNEGCDSLVSINLKIGQTYLDTIKVNHFNGVNFKPDYDSILIPGYYTSNLKSIYGCDSTVVYDLEFEGIYIPTAISPNRDGINDELKILGSSYPLKSHWFTIYNRWGEKIYEGENWNGESNKYQPISGVFLYALEAVTTDDQVIKQTGTVTVLSPNFQ